MSNITFGHPSGADSDNYLSFSENVSKNSKLEHLKEERNKTSEDESIKARDSKTLLVDIKHTALKVINPSVTEGLNFVSETRFVKKMEIKSKLAESEEKNKNIQKEETVVQENVSTIIEKEHETIDVQVKTDYKTSEKERVVVQQINTTKEFRNELNDMHYKIGNKYVSHDALLQKFLGKKDFDRDNIQEHMRQFVNKHVESGDVYKLIDGKYVRLTDQELESYKEKLIEHAVALYDANLLIINNKNEPSEGEKEVAKMREGEIMIPRSTVLEPDKKTIETKKHTAVVSKQTSTRALRLAQLNFIQYKRYLERKEKRQEAEAEMRREAIKEKEFKRELLHEAIKLAELHHENLKSETLNKLLKSVEQFNDLLTEDNTKIEIAKTDANSLNNHQFTDKTHDLAA